MTLYMFTSKQSDKTVPVAVDDQYIIKKGQDFIIDEKGGSLHNDSDPGEIS